MRALLMMYAAVLALGTSGCSAVYSAHPLYTGEDSEEEPSLEGSWTYQEEKTQFCIQKSDPHEYHLNMTDPKSKRVEVYEINLVRLRDQLFADVLFKGQTIDRTEIDPPIGVVSTHVFVRLDVTDDTLTYSILDPDRILEIEKQGYPAPDYLRGDDGLMLTASTDVMRQYISDHIDAVFSNEDHFTRKRETDGTPVAGSSCIPADQP